MANCGRRAPHQKLIIAGWEPLAASPGGGSARRVTLRYTVAPTARRGCTVGDPHYGLAGSGQARMFMHSQPLEVIALSCRRSDGFRIAVICRRRVSDQLAGLR